jgi:nucleoside-diphosphate-sugar epimerase
VVPFPETRRRIEIGDYVADCRKIRRVLGWEARVSLEEGLRRTVGFFAGSERYWAVAP